MVTTKTTSYKFTTPSGSEVVCTITRAYGKLLAGEQTVWLDEPIPAPKDTFIDESRIKASIDGEAEKDYCYRYGSGELECFSAGANIPLRAEDAEIIRNLISERLNGELSPSDVADIERVKRALTRNTILPLAELEARRKEYRAGMLEGGEGFNPYLYYISQEFADRIIKQFPESFK